LGHIVREIKPVHILTHFARFVTWQFAWTSNWEEVEKKEEEAEEEKRVKRRKREKFAVLPFLLSPSLIYSSIFTRLLLFISLFFSPHPNSIGRLSTLPFTGAFKRGGGGLVENFAIEI